MWEEAFMDGNRWCVWVIRRGLLSSAVSFHSFNVGQSRAELASVGNSKEQIV